MKSHKTHKLCFIVNNAAFGLPRKWSFAGRNNIRFNLGGFDIQRGEKNMDNPIFIFC